MIPLSDQVAELEMEAQNLRVKDAFHKKRIEELEKEVERLKRELHRFDDFTFAVPGPKKCGCGACVWSETDKAWRCHPNPAMVREFLLGTGEHCIRCGEELAKGE